MPAEPAVCSSFTIAPAAPMRSWQPGRNRSDARASASPEKEQLSRYLTDAGKRQLEEARDAVACAVAMQRRMSAVNEWNRGEGYPEISMGIGIHSGDAVLGNIGSVTRTKYNMIGRNVNLAARIQGYTKGGQILVSTQTLKAAGDLAVENEAGNMTVRPKGIHEDVLLHDIIGFGKMRVL